ncbi:MAG: penicillin-binding protein 2 [Caedibacter sp. 38-128]|nr:penicillin-binding protein 2 [Holosporales bacterium]OJX03534.1 MAG: penicillin-binding protein 2 [Caedibacter sp. 38-128]
MKRFFSSSDPKLLFTRRAFLIAGAQAAGGALILGRLGYLGIFRSPHYRTLADGNRVKLHILLPRRGIIYDRHGQELAGNISSYRLTIVPAQIDNLPASLSHISQLLNLDLKDSKNILKDLKKHPKFTPYILKQHLTWEEVCKIEVNLPELPGVEIEAGYQRFYLDAEPFAHLIGYVQAPSDKDDVDERLAPLSDYRIGKVGIEKSFQNTLQGVAGYKEVEVNAKRQIIRERKKHESQNGQQLNLSISAPLQKFVYERLQQVESASVVVMDILTGEILSLVSSPSYDTNLFVNGIPKKNWNALQKSPYRALTNKAIHGLYEPGSTFKMAVLLAGLESGRVDPNFQTFCQGYIEVANHRFHCVCRGGHGLVDLRRALQVSCDIYFYEIAQKIGVEILTKMARDLGFGAKTGIEMPAERSGLVPSKLWKLEKHNQRWHIGDTILLSIGQGPILGTPLQLAQMMGRLLTGKYILPTLKKRTVSKLPIFSSYSFNPSYLAMIKDGIDAVINETSGTAYHARINVPGWEMGGKTGTAQVRRITKLERETRILRNEELAWKERDHALFVGYAPVHHPRYVTAVVVEHGGWGSVVAAPIGRDALLKTQELMVS